MTKPTGLGPAQRAGPRTALRAAAIDPPLRGERSKRDSASGSGAIGSKLRRAQLVKKIYGHRKSLGCIAQ